jgi:hypothetical protein
LYISELRFGFGKLHRSLRVSTFPNAYPCEGSQHEHITPTGSLKWQEKKENMKSISKKMIIFAHEI